MKTKVRMLQCVTIVNNNHGESVVVTWDKNDKRVVGLTDVIQLWGDDGQREVIKAILN